MPQLCWSIKHTVKQKTNYSKVKKCGTLFLSYNEAVRISVCIEYVRVHKGEAVKWQYGHYLETMLLNQFVLRVSDDALRLKFLSEQKLLFNKSKK